MFEFTTFALVGMESIEKLLGKPEVRGYGANIFHKHIRYLEFSVMNQFTADMQCCAELRDELPHIPYDFRWLDLGEMANCRQMNIYIAGRQKRGKFRDLARHDCLTLIGARKVVDAFSKLAAAVPRCGVTISTPLRKDVGPEQGFVEDAQLSRLGVRLWKRYTGDMFRASMDKIVTCSERYVYFHYIIQHMVGLCPSWKTAQNLS